ncbi:MAG: tryptophan--tRNA ligase [Acidimicrobiales bacterium]
MTTVFSGFQPSGDFHLGNYLGAFRGWVATQAERDCYFCVVDLHALTLPIDPEELNRRSIEAAVLLLAIGLDPDVVTMFVQSHVPEHTRLAWLLECTASVGELSRMTQYKEKGAQRPSVSAGLLTYPALMAADILLYQSDEVPVGDDQRQHLELARDLAMRFNSRYGETFTVPSASVPGLGARVMDLQRPESKMSKSADSPMGTLGILDSPEEIERKIRRAVTDTSSDVIYDPGSRPGISNLIELFAAATNEPTQEIASRYGSYGALKGDLAEVIVELLAPIRLKAHELSEHVDEVARVVAEGAERARSVAAKTYREAAEAVGLWPSG